MLKYLDELSWKIIVCAIGAALIMPLIMAAMTSRYVFSNHVGYAGTIYILDSWTGSIALCRPMSGTMQCRGESANAAISTSSQ